MWLRTFTSNCSIVLGSHRPLLNMRHIKVVIWIHKKEEEDNFIILSICPRRLRFITPRFPAFPSFLSHKHLMKFSLCWLQLIFIDHYSFMLFSTNDTNRQPTKMISYTFKLPSIFLVFSIGFKNRLSFMKSLTGSYEVFLSTWEIGKF